MAKILESQSHFLLIDGQPIYKMGLLFPHNIVYRKEEISLPFASSLIEKIRSNEIPLDKLDIVSRFGENQEFALLSYDCEDIFKEFHIEEVLKHNTIYKGTVLSKCGKTTIVGVNGHYGFINDITTSQIDEEIYVSVVVNAKNNFGFCQFAEASLVNNSEDLSLEASQSIDDFLTQEELISINDEKRNLIEWLLENTDGLTRKNINVLREELHLSYNPTALGDLNNFLNSSPSYFNENNFWVSCYRDSETQNVSLIIYDNNDVMLQIWINDAGMWVKEFSHDRNKSIVQDLLNMNQKALVISGKKIHLHENSYVKEDYQEAGERIYVQYLVAKTLIPDLKKIIKSIKEKAGVEYLTLKEYLNYQESKEIEYNKRLSIPIGPNQSEIATSTKNGHSTGLFIPEDTGAANLFTDHDTDVCYIELIIDETKIKAELVEFESKNGFIIEFYSSHLPIKSLKESGFVIRRRAGVKHLNLQQDSIEHFVYGYDQFDIFDKLNRGQLRSPDEDSSIIFYDDKFNNVEEGNNQPIAIRKAVGNKDILLIQGPPGTGKTSVIVEIIKQLVLKKGERVLVCSQAHSAVKNIYDRIKDGVDGIKIGNIDEQDTMIPQDIKEHPYYLRNNALLLKKISNNPEEAQRIAEREISSFAMDYSESTNKNFLKGHQYISDYFSENQYDNITGIIEILTNLRDGLSDLGEDAVTFNNARHYQSLNVVMGTCIGIGMDFGLQRSGIKFDTVIIDEAGKANLSETTVPMSLGKKYILVGDEKQLPPYMDAEEISDFMETSSINLSKDEVENAISSSLFEDFLEDENFPQESSVLLNYQYRMNPQIGDYISELFYDNELHNGRGTDLQDCILDGFNTPVTFIDTTTLKKKNGWNVAFEQGDKDSGLYNPREIEIIEKRILPRLERLKSHNPKVTIGIITPYRKQRTMLLQVLRGTILSGCVHTIDSIQGSEFDVVILSLVRAFNTSRNKNKKVGFLDDMRRLNVALSRAKKRLIIIGNLRTLCSETAHFIQTQPKGISPIDVFRKLREIHERTAEKTSLEMIKTMISSGEITIGQIFPDCKWQFEENVSGKRPIFELIIDDASHFFPIPYDKVFQTYGENSIEISVRFLGIGIDGRAKFEFIPKVSIADQISDGITWEVEACAVDWSEDEKTEEMIFKFKDNSELSLPLSNREHSESFFMSLLYSREVKYIPLFIYNGEYASLNKRLYKEFKENYREGEIVKIEVICEYKPESKDISPYYIVKCGNLYGKVVKRKGTFLKPGQTLPASIYRIYDNCINFSVR